MEYRNVIGQLSLFLIGIGLLIAISISDLTYVIVPEIGRWRGMTYTPAQTDQPYPAMSLILDVDADKNTSGVLTIYPVDVPENALELVTKNGCKVNFETSSDAPLDIIFQDEQVAILGINVASCNVKFFGDYTFPTPLQGTWLVEFDEQTTYLLNNPLPVVTTPIELGYKTFIDNCSSCHSSDATGMPGIPALVTERIATMSDLDLMTIINSGVSGAAMPAFGVQLSQEQRDAILLLLRTPDYFQR